MNISFFISSRMRFKSSVTVLSVAVSFLVMIVAVSVSSGFRNEIRTGLASMSGDIQLTPPNLNVLDYEHPIEKTPAYMEHVLNIDGVAGAEPVIYRAGIVKTSDNIHGVLFKGVQGGASMVVDTEYADSIPLAVAIPRRLSEIASVGTGDKITAYFIGDEVRLRRFNVVAVYDAVIETDDRLVVYADLADMQRLGGWNDDQVSAIEIALDGSCRDESTIIRTTQEVGAYVNGYSEEVESPVIATSSVSKYPELFDWLDLIDFNVIFILILMTIVAGFNMISGLLIMLFENISTIGLLKALGMKDGAIAKVFLVSASKIVLKGMLIGNAAAFLFCILQDKMHLLRLDPENYFVSFVPVNMDIWYVLTADMVSFMVIMFLLLIPTLFISKVDPAETVRVR